MKIKNPVAAMRRTPVIVKIIVAVVPVNGRLKLLVARLFTNITVFPVIFEPIREPSAAVGS